MTNSATNDGNPRATPVRIGCAGWSLSRDSAGFFPGSGSHLERYARKLNATESKSSFYRAHKPGTYARWADSVPEDFAFSVKIPKAITHEARLVDCEGLFDVFVGEVQHLGSKLQCLLVQFPPGLAYDERVAQSFFQHVRSAYDGLLAVEPRHETWFTPDADGLLKSICAARVAADPDKPTGAGRPGGDDRLAYWRLHGSPRMYYSRYDEADLRSLATRLNSPVAIEQWCIFDNTASGAAIHNALELAGLVRRPQS